MKEIERSPYRIHCDGIIEDFCDGSVFREHHRPYCIANYDEVEMCNPLGSHTKRHKLSIVFYTLGNLHPKYRSSLSAINLVLVATVPVIEHHGINQILKPLFLTSIYWCFHNC